jgi:hypothetical protein
LSIVIGRKSTTAQSKAKLMQETAMNTVMVASITGESKCPTLAF